MRSASRSTLFAGCCVLALFSLARFVRPALAEEVTNARVVEITKLGLGDDIIIAKIKSGQCKFSLSDNDLLELKKEKVSDKVIAAMLEGNVVKAARVLLDGKPVEMKTLAQAKVGGRLARMATAGLKSQKQKAYLQGAFSDLTVGASPVIELELPTGEPVENYVLVRMDSRGDRRELEVASRGGVVGAKQGLNAESIVKTNATAVEPNHYKIALEHPLMSGEYFLYVVGSADFTKGIYGKGCDFGVR